MSISKDTDRINTLLIKADEFIQADNLQQAAEALREVTRLDPSNPKVKDKWAALQGREGTGEDVLDLLRTYIGSKEVEDGQKALQALRSRPLSQLDAAQAIELLLHTRSDADLLDTLTSALLSQSVEARKAIASKLASSPTEAFELLSERGEHAFNAFSSVPLEAFLWPSQDQQVVAQKDVFRLCIARLIEPGADHLEWAMKCTARLLAVVSENIRAIIDADVLDVILSFLDIRLEISLRSQATLATSKLLEATGERGEALFSDFITLRAAKQTNDDLILVFSAAAAVFPIIPAVAARLFLTDGFVQQLVPNLERNSEDGKAGKRKSNTLETAALELLSAACVDGNCREAIKRYCSPWLETLADEGKGNHKAIAAVILAKVNTESADAVTARLKELVLANDQESDQAIEGLAYTSLRPSIKEELVKNDQLIKRLVTALKERPAVMFGCLTIFANLTVYRPSLSEERKKMSQLKAYANTSKPPPDDPLDNPTPVTERCRKVLEANIVPAMVECSKQTASPMNAALMTQIMLSLAREQKHRVKMAQQGAVRLLLQIHGRITKMQETVKDAPAIQRSAAHALARLLISVNPDHMFSASLPASNAVSALAPLLTLDQDSDQRDLLPTFEALLALTNLASMEDSSVRDLEIRLAWTQLEDHLLLSSNTLVQRASMELVCNLMPSPTCVTKFVGDGSKRESTRMQILLALADAEDLATRRAAGGALAVLTEWDAAVTAILNQNKDGGPKGVKALLGMCADESDEVKHRGFACVSNVIGAPGDIGKRGLDAVKHSGGKEVLQEALKKTKDRDVMQVGVDVLKKLM